MAFRPSNSFHAPPPSQKRGIAAFSLIEVVLAIGIATGLLVIALLFYRQAAELRGQILVEADRFSTIRLTLDRLAADLRAARGRSGPANRFSGDATSISFVKAAFNYPQTNALSPDAGLLTDLVRVSLSAVLQSNDTKLAVAGVQWNEAPATPFQQTAPTNLLLSALPVDPSPSVTNTPEPVLEAVKYVRFRYWDGNAWRTGWTNDAPPHGVEIVFATETLPDDAAEDDLPPEPFRRVVLIPAGATRSSRQGGPQQPSGAPAPSAPRPSRARPKPSA